MHHALAPINNANDSSFDLSFVKGNPSIINWRVFGILKLCNMVMANIPQLICNFYLQIGTLLSGSTIYEAFNGRIGDSQ